MESHLEMNSNAASSAAAEQSRDQVTFIGESSPKEIILNPRDIFDELEEFSGDEIDALAMAMTRKSIRQRIAGQVKAGKLFPLINVPRRLLLLPSTFKNVDNMMGTLMLTLGRVLGYRIKQIPYDEKLTSISENREDFVLGMYLSLSERDVKVNITDKVNPRDLGRTFARAQQLIGASISAGRGPEILKRRNKFYGNNPKEVVEIDKKEYPVPFLARDIPSYFQEVSWGERLSNILLTLLKESWSTIDLPLLDSWIAEEIIPVEEMIRLYCTFDVVVEPATRRHEAITKAKVPGKPRANALLLKEEFAYLRRVVSPLFGQSPLESLDRDEWTSYIIDHGFADTRKHLRQTYSRRAEFLQKFASATSSRLRAMRSIIPGSKNKRKKDVTSVEVATYLVARTDLSREYATEIYSMDEDGSRFIAEYYFRSDNDPTSYRSRSKEDVIKYIAADIVNNGVYNNIEEQLAEAEAWVKKVNAEADKVKHDPILRSFRLGALAARPKRTFSTKITMADYLSTKRKLIATRALPTYSAVAQPPRKVIREENLPPEELQRINTIRAEELYRADKLKLAEGEHTPRAKFRILSKVYGATHQLPQKYKNLQSEWNTLTEEEFEKRYFLSVMRGDTSE
jgi:hypothetical protein